MREGKIKLVYHLKTFLDANLRTTHSLVMGNAAMCAADAGGPGGTRRRGAETVAPGPLARKR